MVFFPAAAFSRLVQFILNDGKDEQLTIIVNYVTECGREPCATISTTSKYNIIMAIIKNVEKTNFA